MKQDISEILRAWATTWESGMHARREGDVIRIALLREAAAEIGRLRDQVARMEGT